MFVSIRKSSNLISGDNLRVIAAALNPLSVCSSVNYTKAANAIRLESYRLWRLKNDRDKTITVSTFNSAVTAFFTSYQEYLAAVIQIKPALNFALLHLINVLKSHQADRETIRFVETIYKQVDAPCAKTFDGRKLRTIADNDERLQDLAEEYAPYISTIIGAVASLWDSKLEFVEQSREILTELGLELVAE